MPQKKILVVGQLPPPFHGQAVVNQLVFDAEWNSFGKVTLPMRYSKTIDDVGSAGIAKVLHLIYLILKTWQIWLTVRPEVLYYPPASANKVPVIRDILYLGMTRFLFKKTVFHFHAGGLGQYLDSIGRIGKLAKWAYRKPDLAIELYREPDSPGAYLGAKKVAIIPNGLSVEQPVASMAGEAFSIMFMGALREDKGVLDVLRTVAELKKRGVTVTVSLAGAWSSENFEKGAKALVEQLGVNDEVNWLGVIQGEDKWQTLRSGHCFFFPTFYHSEKFPLVLIEALGMGLPVVTTNWRGIPQLVDGADGAVDLHELADVQGFADSLEVLAKDREICIQGGVIARKHYAKNYTLEKFLESMEGHLLEVIQD